MAELLIHTAATPPELEHRLCALAAPWHAADPLHPLVVVVPSNAVRARLRGALARRVGMRAGVRLWTMRDLARHLAESELLAAGRSPLQPPADLLLIEQRVAPLAADADGPFAAGAAEPGFAQALAETFKDLGESGIAPASVPSLDDASMVTEVARLYRAFRDAMAELGLYDTVDVLDAACRAPARLPDDAGTLLLFGFYDLTGLQRRLVAHLAATLDIHAFVPVPPADDAHSYGSALHTWLANQGFRGVEGDAHPDAGDDFGDIPLPPASDLSRLQSHCFARALPAPVAAFDGTVRVASVPGGIREIRETARTLLDWRREGVPWSEMAVLYHGPGDTGALIREVLAGIRVPLAGDEETARLPVRTPEDPTLAETVAGRALIALCALRGSAWSRSAVIEALGMAPLLASAGPAPTARWEAAARDAGVVAGRRQWSDRLEAFAARLERDSAHQGDREDGEGERRRAIGERRAGYARACRDAVAAVDDALQAIPDSATPAELCEAAITMLQQVIPDDDTAVPGLTAVVDAVRALSGVRQVTDELSWDRFHRLVVDTLRSTRSRAARPPADGVFIGGLYGARGLAFRRVAVVGLNERRFPPPVREDPLLPDALRKRIRDALPESRLPLAEERPAEDRMLFALALAAATERVWLSVPRVEPGSGRALVPSLFALRAVEAVAGRQVRALEPTPEGLEDLILRVPFAPLPPEERGRALDAAEFDLSVIAEAVHTGDGALLAGLAGEAEPESLRRALTSAQHRLGDRTLTAWDGVLSHADSLAALAGAALADSARSPSRLEAFAACPYRFFLRYLLKLEAPEEPDETARMAASDRGTLIHGVLEEFVRAWCDRLPLDDNSLDDALAEVDALLDRWFEKYRAEGRAGAPVVAEADRERIRPHLHTYLRDELTRTDFVPIGVEVAFGLPPNHPDDPHSPEPVTLELPDGQTLQFRGFIDRVDAAPSGERRVVDYKTGRKLPDPSKIARGEALQLPVYALAAQAAFGTGETTSARYEPVGPKTRKTAESLEGEALENARAALIDVALLVGDHVRTGRFPAHPSEDTCLFCDFQGICGPSRIPVWERKQHDPQVADYLAMRRGERDV